MSEIVNASTVTELDQQAESLISEMATEFADSGLDAEIESVEAAPVAPETPVVAETPGATAAPKPEETKPEDPGYERLVAREVALLEREKHVKGWETERSSYEDKIKSLEARAIPDDWAMQLEADPEPMLQKLGVDPEQLVRTVLARRFEAQGKEVPEELAGSLKANRDKINFERKLQALQAKFDAQEREAAAKTFFDQVSSGAREYVTTGISEKHPTVSQVAKRNPDWVHGQIMEVISQDAQQKAARDPNARLLSYEEAAGFVEKHLSNLHKLLNPENASTTQPNTPVSGAKNGNPPQPAQPTQTNVTKQGVPVISPPERPLAPWLQKPESDDSALKEALMEYRRVEKLGKSV